MNGPPVLRKRAERLLPRLRRLRRAIHAYPELGLDTPKTQALVVKELERIGVDSLRLGKRCTSVVAEIAGNAGMGPTVALRADMDALPLVEESGLSFASRVHGRMHACGHDAHTAMLLGAAHLLVGEKERLCGRVRLLFQPGEEGYGGARVMIEEGALDGVTRAFALHIDPTRARNRLAARPGPMLAAFDNFHVTFRGRGGHASTPHRARDPIPVACALVDALSHVAARETDPDDRTVVSVTTIHAGSGDNIIPSTASCSGTIRTLTPRARRTARARLRRVARGVARTYGVSVDVEIVEGYPPTINDEASLDLVRAAARGVGLRFHSMKSAFMGAEDFSYVLDRVPGAFVFLGAATEPREPLHSDRMRIDESALAAGAALHAAVAMQVLVTDRSERRGS